MSLRTPAAAYPRQKNEAYYTPPRHVRPLVEALPLGLMRGFEAWECAAGAGHIASVLKDVFPVVATDLHPAKTQVHPVAPLDFLKSAGLSGRNRLAIITNPPYGFQNRLASAFLAHALGIAGQCNGLVAMLLPFEYDARLSRLDLVGAHPAFAAKITLAERIRWINIAQKQAAPMAHHSWFVWAFDRAIRQRLAVQQLRVA